jgi:hypothetical protein
MKPIPRGLLEQIQQLAPPDAEVVPLEWAYDGEDYNLAVFVGEGEDHRALEDRLLDAVNEECFLKNVVEQDHRSVKRVTRPMLGFKLFAAAQSTLVGIELRHTLKKNQHPHINQPHETLADNLRHIPPEHPRGL